ncbi:hypothetical protein SAMN05444358_10851 [Ruegeria halocynthiae]|uniref:Immunity MXAN-0049 protein domain-containing protein n=1 Tax=Ruegeria halocynthiae TaxID=985054 RepID=A0A1H3DCC1_9RHOB|nr:DUF1629 domain-containing protein [Ruegeria halocynthiae]SDX63798.1 hypothetical protein SAMN05444358_10851 [Ruegeria halocynthiae]
MANDDSDAPCVWIATTVNNINVIQGVSRREYTDNWRARQPAERVEWSKSVLRQASQAWKSGEILTAEQVGDVWHYNSKAEYYTAPFISGGGWPLVSETAKGILEQFDLRETVFHPLTLIDSTESYLTTPEPYYLLNVGNKRSVGNYDVLGPEGDVRSPLSNRYGKTYLPRSNQEKALVVVPEALGGPDIWLDPKVPNLLFLSDHLVSGLKSNGVDKGWGLIRCPVGTLSPPTT